ncbi:MAG: DUF123 domain-containing protein [Dehalococcoidia bacterium]|nr:DUF123 domain-containing protein [Dehalococcoidia bacterium]
MERMDMHARDEYLKVIRERYFAAEPRKGKSQILNEYCGNTGQSRKYVITKIHSPDFHPRQRERRKETYDGQVKTALAKIWYAIGPDKLECKWNTILRNLPGATPSIPGFGASDCRCSSHLTHFQVTPPLGLFKHGLEQNNLPQVYQLNELNSRSTDLDCTIPRIVGQQTDVLAHP